MKNGSIILKVILDQNKLRKDTIKIAMGNLIIILISVSPKRK